MNVKVGGKVWGFHRKRMRGQYDGLCDPPDKPGKTITVDARLKDEEELEVIVHELMHALDWHKSEEAVDGGAKDFARVLWRMGYRKQ